MIFLSQICQLEIANSPSRLADNRSSRPNISTFLTPFVRQEKEKGYENKRYMKHIRRPCAL
jgi:hypothetical protein